MRTMIKASIPVEAGNAGIANGDLPAVIQGFTQSAKPEAAYFTAIDGRRTMIAVFDLASPSDIPRIAEPFFTKLNATVEFSPCMNADDLAKGLSALG